MILFAFTLHLRLGAQDKYHLELLDFLREEFEVEHTGYVLYDSEKEINEKLIIYGDQDSRVTSIESFTFSQQVEVCVNAAGANVWDSGINIRNTSSINKGDVVLISFWAKHTSTTSEIKLFSEDANSFEKEIYSTIQLTPDWTQYFATYKSSADFTADALTLGFHIAAQDQKFQLAGFTALNFGQIDINSLPSTFSAANYGGHEADAA